MRSAVLCALLPLCAGYVRTSWRDLAANRDYSYGDYIVEYEKSYTAEEFARRKAIFEANLATIRAHNSDSTQSWKMGLNAFTDWEESEVTQKRKGLAKGRMGVTTQVHSAPAGFKAPVAVDWRNRSVVTPVKNQGGCGSCWAFSATEVLESAAAIATGKLSVLGPQQMVSCTPNPNECGGTGGCQGATQPLGLNYTAQAGLSLEADYPYTARTGVCDKRRIKPAVGNKGVAELATNDYNALMHAVTTVGPVAVSVAASWTFYESGVFDNERCGYTVDHGVVVVGFGHDERSNKDYWIVRNSWGAQWGERGYIRIARFGDGKEPCGMDRKPQDGIACKGQTQPVRYCGLCAILSASSYPTGAFNY